MSETLSLSPKEVRRLQAMQSLKDGSVTQAQAAAVLGTSERQVRRLYRRFREQGPSGVVSGHRGKRAANRLDSTIEERAVELIRARYPDFGPSFANQKLRELHGITISTESLRRLMIGAQLWKPKRGKAPRSHPSRNRRPRVGELVQIDGSPHDWFEDRGPRCTLIVFIDDASSRLLGLRFVPAEATWPYFDVARATIEKYGKPLAYYSDKHSIFRINMPSEGAIQMSQFGRALHELDIELICANSPQAKGRVERANRTLQDRLIKELRLQGIAGIDAANAFLPAFIDDYNARFSIEPHTQEDAHRVLGNDEDLDVIFSLRYEHRVSKNLIVQHDKKRYHIEEPARARRLQHLLVTLSEQRDGSVSIHYDGKPLAFRVLPTHAPNGEIVDGKTLNARLDAKASKPRTPHIPAANHPWRRYQRRPTAPAA
jgi:transposase